jgi:hypothetical protein
MIRIILDFFRLRHHRNLQQNQTVEQSSTAFQANGDINYNGMDFRGALIKAGGEGGKMGGGGGSGGVIHFVGYVPQNEDELIDLTGTDAIEPGAGGGGAGSIVINGRKAEQKDINNGLRIISFFPANFAEYNKNSPSLIDVQGGGWEWMELESIPTKIRIYFVAIFETGLILSHTVLAFNMVLIGPLGEQIVVDNFDVRVTDLDRKVKRSPIVRLIEFEIETPGTWVFKVISGSYQFVSYELEIRNKRNSE